MTRRLILALDPFAGSGTTLAVAEELGRDWIGIDIAYEELIRDRLSRVQRPLFPAEGMELAASEQQSLPEASPKPAA